MTPERRKKLEGRRVLLQQKHQVAEFVESRVRPFVEILQTLKDHRAHCNIVRFHSIPPAWDPFLDQMLTDEPFAQFELNKVPRERENHVIHNLLDIFPSANPFRYVPDLPLMPDLHYIYSLLPADVAGGSNIYLSYFPYPFILQLPLAELLQVREDDLFNIQHEDVVIFPENYDWLIAFSLEEEWRYGKR